MVLKVVDSCYHEVIKDGFFLRFMFDGFFYINFQVGLQLFRSWQVVCDEILFRCHDLDLKCNFEVCLKTCEDSLFDFQRIVLEVCLKTYKDNLFDF